MAESGTTVAPAASRTLIQCWGRVVATVPVESKVVRLASPGGSTESNRPAVEAWVLVTPATVAAMGEPVAPEGAYSTSTDSGGPPLPEGGAAMAATGARANRVTPEAAAATRRLLVL